MITESSLSIAEKSWSRMKPSQKKQYLKYRGFNTSFAQTKSIPELVKRGGGMVAKDFLYVIGEYKKRNPQHSNIAWK